MTTPAPNHRSRRNFLAITALGAVGATGSILGLTACTSPAAAGGASPTGRSAAPGSRHFAAAPEFTALEQEFDARLGVFAIDLGSGDTVEHRADERFAYASTIKALAAAAILQTRTVSELETVIHYTAEDLVSYSPITEQHVDAGMTLRDIATAAVQHSDNTAGNLMFAQLGGPAGLNELLRSTGDATTHVDRIEPDLNEAVPGDVRDTSTPRALATTLRANALGAALPQPKRELLSTWLVGNTTGGTLIRAAAPADWTVGDKTGAASYGTRNDIAVLCPPTAGQPSRPGGPAGSPTKTTATSPSAHPSPIRGPIVIAVLSSRAAQDASSDDALVSRAAAIAFTAFGFPA